MSTLKKNSRFFYNTSVTRFIAALDFDEGGGEIQATLEAGNYSLTEYAAELQRAMRAAGSQDYVVTINRATRVMTISAPNPFSLLVDTGSRSATGVWGTIGAGAADLTGSNTYTMAGGTGKQYDLQYYAREYTATEHSIELEDAAVSSTPLGLAQVASFGDGSRIPMNITLITNKTGLKNVGFVENPTGVVDFMDFIKYAMTKGRLEFMADKTVPATFVKCYLEATAQDRDGRKFQLQNMAPDFYESGRLIFRKVLV